MNARKTRFRPVSVFKKITALIKPQKNLPFINFTVDFEILHGLFYFSIYTARVKCIKWLAFVSKVENMI